MGYESDAFVSNRLMTFQLVASKKDGSTLFPKVQGHLHGLDGKPSPMSISWMYLSFRLILAVLS
jgi:hypothetical protein